MLTVSDEDDRPSREKIERREGLNSHHWPHPSPTQTYSPPPPCQCIPFAATRGSAGVNERARCCLIAYPATDETGRREVRTT